MPASIYGERFAAFRGGPGWHNLGTVKDDPNMTAVEAIKEAGLDYEYRTVPVGYELPGIGFVQDADRVAILRGPNKDGESWERLGIVSGDYRYLQNVELAEGVDAIREKTGWPVETVGALGQGETVFMTLFSGKASIKGDEVQKWFLVTDGKAADRSLSISSVGVRVVCQNTLMAAERSASTQIKISHGGDVQKDYSMWTEIIPSLEKQQEGMFAELGRMANVRVDRKGAERIIAAAFADPKANKKAVAANVILEAAPAVSNESLARLVDAKNRHEAELDRMLDLRKAVFGRYEELNDNAEDLPAKVIGELAGTPYMVLQAVTETVDWGDSRRGKTSESAAIFGAKRNIKIRAWNAALSASR